METADRRSRIYRLSTFPPHAAPPHSFTFNQFFIDADEPLLFYCDMRPLFSSVRAAFKRVADPTRRRWIVFSHVEGDAPY